MVEPFGLSTRDAMRRLAEDVDDVLRKHCGRTRSRWRSLRLSLRDSVTWNYRSLAYAGVFLLLLLLAIAVERRALDIFMFLFILGASGFNTLLVYTLRWKRWILCKQKVEEIRGVIEALSETDTWPTDSVYPNLYQPTTPSVHLQWTYRDGRLVNLPACLLVRGDLVLLRPGQEIFAECRSVDELSQTAWDGEPESADREGDAAAAAAARDERYSPGQVFRPAVEATSPSGNVSVPTQHKVQLPRTFGVTKTPFVDSLELMLVRAAEDKTSPWRSIPELSLCKGLWLVYLVTTLLLLLGLVQGIALYLAHPPGQGSMAELFLRPVYVAYCLHPLLFPCGWVLLRAWLASQFRLFSDSSCMSALGSHASLASTQSREAASDSDTKAEGSLGGSDRMTLLVPAPVPPNVSLRRQVREMWRVLSAWDAAASELVFSLGTLTVLCCVDKKGVLSLPQPTVDKVFFLRRRHHRHGSLLTACPTSGSLRRGRRRSEASMCSGARRDDNYSTIGSQGSARGLNFTRYRNFVGNSEVPHVPAVLDFHAHVLEVGNLPHRPYEQLFEDRHWQRYINSLKPIGLNILLNNCNQEMFSRYTTFADYLTLLADRSPEGREVAAINHRCMCGLARRIGFVRSATQPFQLSTSLAAFRHCGLPDESRQGAAAIRSSLQERLFRALSSSHHRTPMAHVLSAVTAQARVGSLQLMSQGSADLLLDLCVDYWDGHDLTPLREPEKRRALDFYHRHIHSAYCTAFAYSPLFESIAEPMADVVLEVPLQTVNRAAAGNMCQRVLLPSGHHLPGVQTLTEIGQRPDARPPDPDPARPRAASPASGRESPARAGRVRSLFNHEMGNSPIPIANLNRSMSAESLMSRLSAESISTSEDCMELLKNQVFLGMASLQYQPLADVIPLVNQLQGACVRFVHFSQENELRSRVFAEKLGLEAGSFNCHISLAESGPLCASGAETPGGAGMVHRSSQGMQEPAAGAGGAISRWDSAPVVMGSTSYVHRASSTGEAAAHESEDRLEISFDPAETPDHSPCNPALDRVRNSDGGLSGCSSQTTVTPNSDSDSITLHLRQDKSQMPRGIAAIRPHLKNVDNIPLQVSLFTDCSPDAVREMLEIMQENGEIVGAVGSTLSLHNTAIFLQADCSVGLQPETPYVCVGCEGEALRRSRHAHFQASPVGLASRLLSLPCSLAGMREMGLRFMVPSMADCRALVQRMRLASAFYFCCGAFVAGVQLFSVAVGWPAGPAGRAAHDFFLFDGSCLLWLQVVSLPLLTLPVLLCPTDKEQVMKKPPTKRDVQWVHKRLKRQLLYACARCLPSLAVCLLLAHFSVMTACARPGVACAISADNATANATAVLTNAEMQRSAGQFCFLFALCYLAVISLSYVNEGKRLLDANRRSLALWAVFSGVHVVVTFAAIVPMNVHTFALVHPAVWVAGVLWIVFLLLLNALVDYKENSINVREERRIRFMFNTKLGMYSPV